MVSLSNQHEVPCVAGCDGVRRADVSLVSACSSLVVVAGGDDVRADVSLVSVHAGISLVSTHGICPQ